MLKEVSEFIKHVLNTNIAKHEVEFGELKNKESFVELFLFVAENISSVTRHTYYGSEYGSFFIIGTGSKVTFSVFDIYHDSSSTYSIRIIMTDETENNFLMKEFYSKNSKLNNEINFYSGIFWVSENTFVEKVSYELKNIYLKNLNLF